MASSTPIIGLSGIPRVNLIPRSEIDRRDRAAAIRRWGWGVIAALAVVLLATLGAFYLNFVAQQRLATEQVHTTTLLTELSSLSDVSVALAAQSELEAFRAQAMATDMDWQTVYATLTSQLPAGVVLTGFDLTAGAAPVAGSDPQTQVGLDGQLTFTSPTPVEVAPLIRSYRALAGVIEADGSQISAAGANGDTTGQYTYQLTITFDQSLYTGAYATDGGK